MDNQEHTLLRKIVKKSATLNRCYISINCIIPILLTTDIVLLFVQKDNLNIGLYISLLVIAAILVIVSFLLVSQIKLLRELKDWLLNKDDKG